MRITKAKNGPVAFKVIRWLIGLFSPKIEVVGLETMPDEPVILVGNHAQMYGPIACELYLPEQVYIWCAGQMMELKSVPAYAFEDFWSKKPKYIRWFYKVLSYLIAPLSVLLFNNARTIAVHRDKRILTTFRQTISHLQDGHSVVIFPEHNVPFNHIVHTFQDRFIDLAKLYHRRTGKELAFVPIYIAPGLSKLCLGEPIRFCAGEDMERERARICAQLMDAVTELAQSLPRHRVVPYPNVPKRDYPMSIPGQAKVRADGAPVGGAPT